MNITEEQKIVARNIFYAVESGGQVYGDADYTLFTAVGENTENETAITIGAGQWYGTEAKELLTEIKTADRAAFLALDVNHEINKDLRSADFTEYNVDPESDKAKVIISMIDSEVGHKCQDEKMIRQITSYMTKAEEMGIKTVAAQIMCANWAHQGGLSAMSRLITRCMESGNPTLDNLYAACCKDTEPNQVGTYKERQLFVYTELKNRIGVVDEDIYKPVVKPSENVRKAQKKFNYVFDFNVKEDGILSDEFKVCFVKGLQYALNQLYGEKLDVDGDYGTLTQRAVFRHPLRGGERNYYVTLVQMALYFNEHPLETGMNGYYDNITITAVREFQTEHNIERDGQVGKYTMNALLGV